MWLSDRLVGVRGGMGGFYVMGEALDKVLGLRICHMPLALGSNRR